MDAGRRRGRARLEPFALDARRAPEPLTKKKSGRSARSFTTGNCRPGLLLFFLGGRPAGRRALVVALALFGAVLVALHLRVLALVRLVGSAARAARALVLLRGVTAAGVLVAAAVAPAMTLVVLAVTLAALVTLRPAFAGAVGVLIGARAAPSALAAGLALRAAARALVRGVLVLRARLLGVRALVVAADGLAALVALADLRIRLHVRRYGDVTGLRIRGHPLRERDLAEGSGHKARKGITEHLAHRLLL